MTLLDKALKKPSPRLRPNQTDLVGLASTDGLTLEKVLENQTARPFSLREFSDYLEQTYCYENLAFYMAVTDYRESARLYFGNAPDVLDEAVIIGEGLPFRFLLSESECLNHEQQIRFDTLRAKFQDILERFILTNSPQEINIPCELRIQLLQVHRDRQSYHPALLKAVCVAVVELLRISAFIPFATDPDRLFRAAATSSTVPKASRSHGQKPQQQEQRTSSPQRLRSSPALTHSGSDGAPTTLLLPPVPTIPRPAEGGLLSPKWFDFDEVSVMSSTSGTTATSSSTTNAGGILKKLTTSLRFRARSQSPPRPTGWKQIMIPDPSLFMNTSTPITTTPAMERALSNGSITSSSSTASSHGSMGTKLPVGMKQQLSSQHLDTQVRDSQSERSPSGGNNPFFF